MAARSPAEIPVLVDSFASIETQNALGADVIMAFDECPPFPAEREQVERAVERTTRWARRSQEAHARSDQLLFGIVQGGVYEDLRERSIAQICDLGFAGYAIGGVAVGELPEEIRRVAELSAARLPVSKPRYLMGVGTPDDLVDLVGVGIDMFDCVLPTLSLIHI